MEAARSDLPMHAKSLCLEVSKMVRHAFLALKTAELWYLTFFFQIFHILVKTRKPPFLGQPVTSIWVVFYFWIALDVLECFQAFLEKVRKLTPQKANLHSLLLGML